MKKIAIKITAIISAVVFAAGCISETFPKGSTLTSEQVDNSEYSLSYLVNGIPSAMMAAGTAGYASQYGYHADFGIAAIHFMTESMLEDLTVSGELGYYWFGAFLQNLSMGADYIYGAYFWDCYYAWIKLTNEIISRASAMNLEDDAEVRDYLGQAYAYRAMFYLDLARIYEPKRNGYTEISSDIEGLTVPIVDEFTTEEIAKNNPRATREDIYGFILADLENAEKFLDSKATSYTRPTLSAVYGLYARAYLEMGYTDDAVNKDYNVLAAEYARKAITTSGKTPLTQAQWEDPANGFNSGNSNNAWIWGLTLSVENSSNLITGGAHLVSEAKWGYGVLSQPSANKAFYEQIDNADFRKHSWLDPKFFEFYNYKLAGNANDQQEFLNGSYYQYAASPYQSLKFRPASGECNDYTIGNLVDCMLMRVEEMYFIEIEATLRTSGPDAARELLHNFIRKYRYSSYDCTLVTGSESSFIREMMLQKRIEFWGEGILFYDYKRLNQGITRGYAGTNFPSVARFNTTGRSPQWNVCITRGETQSNNAVPQTLNNPDPTGKMELWTE